MNEQLYILWTNDNIITAEKMVFMYGFNALKHKWWDKVTIIIWGATTKLVSENKSIQEKIKEMIVGGVKVSACKACADMLGVSDMLLALGIEVKYWGEPLTKILKENERLLTI